MSQKDRIGQKESHRFRWVKDKTKIFSSVVQVREHILTNLYGKKRDYTKISFDDLNDTNYEIEVQLLKMTKQHGPTTTKDSNCNSKQPKDNST